MHNRQDDQFYFAQLSAITSAELLRQRARLSHVLVIPREFIGIEDWRATNPRFNAALGRAAARFFERELLTSVALGDVRDMCVGTDGVSCPTKPEIRMGVAGGTTIFTLFYSLPPQDDKFKNLMFRFDPLVAGPIPHNLYSAGTVAEVAAERFKGKVTVIANILAQEDKVQIQKIPYRGSEVDDLDWIVLGIGARDSGALKTHLATVADYTNADRERAVGDISSRIFDANGMELGSKVSDRFVNIGFADLERLSVRENSNRRRRVVVIAGGFHKIDAMTAMLRRTPKLFNFLITDELTARLLIRRLGDTSNSDCDDD